MFLRPQIGLAALKEQCMDFEEFRAFAVSPPADAYFALLQPGLRNMVRSARSFFVSVLLLGDRVFPSND